jgi:hypothetical protein
VARVSAWLLLTAIIISVVSGWGITRTEVIYNLSFGIVDRGIANSIHRGTQIPMVAIFLVHVLVNIRIIFSRSTGKKRLVIDAVLIAMGIIALGITILMERV